MSSSNKTWGKVKRDSRKEDDVFNAYQERCRGCDKQWNSTIMRHTKNEMLLKGKRKTKREVVQ